MIHSVDIAWIAGLLEGEGSFLVAKRSVCIMLSMTDRDIVQRAASLFHCPVGGCDFDSRQHRKPIWRIRFYGTHAASWMMTIYSLMGERRKTQIEKCLEYWKPQNNYKVRVLGFSK